MSIRELIEAVEAGREPSVDEWRAVLPDYHRAEMAFAANQGWVDAALALMQAVLPRKRVQTIYEADDGSWLALLVDRETNYNTVRGAAGSLARALLLAILKAKEGETP